MFEGVHQAKLVWELSPRAKPKHMEIMCEGLVHREKLLQRLLYGAVPIKVEVMLAKGVVEASQGKQVNELHVQT